MRIYKITSEVDSSRDGNTENMHDWLKMINHHTKTENYSYYITPTNEICT